jgi:hypothetical protein
MEVQYPPTKTLKPQKEKAVLMILKMEPLRFCGVTSFWEVEQLRPILAAQKNEKKKEKKKDTNIKLCISSNPGIPISLYFDTILL